MEITLDKKNNTEGTIKIKLTEGDYQPHVEEKVRDYSRKANIKGFRPGKVPAGVIKKMFGKSILVDEINHVVSHKLTDYIKENKLNILGEPLPNHEKVSTIDWDNQKDFEFEYHIGMVDDFQYELSSKVKVKSYPIEVDDKAIEETMNDLRERFGKVTYPETSEATSRLFGELRTKEGELINEHALVEIEKVEKKEQKRFIGLKKEEEVEFEIDKAFTDETSISGLLNISTDEAKQAKGTYVFKVSTISGTEQAEMNQELFDRVFGRDAVKTEEEFKNKVKETITENYNRETEHFLEHNIEDHVIAHTNINLPDEFLKTWLKTSGKGRIDDAVLEKEFEDYKRGLKWDLVKNKIAEDNKITVESEEVISRAKELILSQFGGQAFAEQLSDRLDAIANNYLQNENGQNFIKLYNQIRNEKILKHIKENITIQEQKVSVDEFKKIVKDHKH